MSQTALADGSLLTPPGRRYRIESTIEAGGFGIAYRAVREAASGSEVAAGGQPLLEPGSIVVVKEYYPAFARRENGVIDVDDLELRLDFRAALHRFRREAERLCYLSCLRGLRAARLAIEHGASGPLAAIDAVCARTGADIVVSAAIGLLERLDGEARAAAVRACDAAPLPVVHDYFTVGGNAYYVMEYLAGGTLKALIERERRDLGAFDCRIGERSFRVRRPWRADRLKAFAASALDALEELHEGIPGETLIHCDLKPANIMFRHPGSTMPVLIDFGLSRDVDGVRSQTLLAGTGGYAPLEIDPMARSFHRDRGPFGSGHVGPWTDIYGLAAILRVLGTGIDGSHLPGVLQRCDGDRTVDPMTTLPPFGDDYGPALVMAIDHGLGVAIEDRPQGIAAWRRELGVRDPPPPSQAHPPRSVVASAVVPPRHDAADSPRSIIARIRKRPDLDRKIDLILIVAAIVAAIAVALLLFVL